MLLQPFAAAAVLAREFNWLSAAALATAVAAFAAREPLLVLARQRWVWRERRKESADAARYLAWEAALLAACGAALWMNLPRGPLALMGGVAAAMTGVAVWAGTANRQRSIALQVASAAALALTAPLAALAGTGAAPGWAWVLWALMSLHGASAVFVVHARLAARAGRGAEPMRRAWMAQWAQAPAAAWLWAQGGAWVPVAFSMAANGIELLRLKNARNLQEPLRRVGWRTLAASVAHGALCVAALW